MRWIGSALALVMLGLSLPPRGAAQSWVVVPVVVGSSEDADLSAMRARTAISAGLEHVAPIMDPKTARETFELRGSSAPVAATHGDIDQLARDARQALYHVAMGLYTSASDDVQRVLARADRALESLNRETLAARQLLDSCLFIVRARMQERKPKAARQQALECRRLVPDIEPDASMHPPDVIGELAAAEAELEAQRPAALRVTSEPSGCPVFVQGRNLGSTPLELPRLSPGDYRIQVECVPGEYGRVHRITLGQSRAVVHVDSHFDAAVQSGDGVSLRYGSAAASGRLALLHGVEVGRLVGARYAALIAPEPGGAGAIRISALEVTHGRVLAQVLVRVDESGEIAHLSEAIHALRDGQSVDFLGVAPAPLAQTQTMPAPPAVVSASALPVPVSEELAADGSDASSGPESAPSAVGWTLGATGVASYLTAWVLYAHQLGLEADYRKVRGLQDTSEAQRRRARIASFELVPPLVGGAGAAATTVALAWLLPPSRKVPPWSLGVGIGGLVLTGGGIALLIRGSSCTDFDRLARCDDVVSTSHLGALLLETAVPLLSVPIVHFIRLRGGPEDSGLSLRASRRAVSLNWRGTL
jgi:hypothetical protein